MLRFMKLVFADYKSWVFTLITIPFTVIVLAYWNTFSDEVHNLLIGLLGSILLILTQGIIFFIYKFVRFIDIEGTYEPYSYEDLEKEAELIENGQIVRKKFIYEGQHTYQLKSEKNGEAKLTYKGGNEFSIELTENGGNRWRGEMWFNEIYMADISWSYVSRQFLTNACGFKKAVLIEGKPRRIYLFSPDNQGFGREVLIKKEN